MPVAVAGVVVAVVVVNAIRLHRLDRRRYSHSIRRLRC